MSLINQILSSNMTQSETLSKLNIMAAHTSEEVTALVISLNEKLSRLNTEGFKKLLSAIPLNEHTRYAI